MFVIRKTFEYLNKLTNLETKIKKIKKKIGIIISLIYQMRTMFSNVTFTITHFLYLFKK